MQSMADELEFKTSVYWQVSQCWNGRSKAEVSTGLAISLMNQTIFSLNPSRPLVRAAAILLDEIIDDVPRSSNASANLLPLPQLITP